MPSRRSVLAGAASLLTAGAGCTGVLGGARPDPALRDITLRNTDDKPHVLAVRLSHESEVILDRTYDLGAWPHGDEGGTESGDTGTGTDEGGTTTDEDVTTTEGDAATTGEGSTTTDGKATPAGDVSDHLAAIADAWDSPRGEFAARVRVDDRDPVEFRLDDSFRPGVTYRYEIRIEADGRISTWATVLDPTATTSAQP